MTRNVLYYYNSNKMKYFRCIKKHNFISKYINIRIKETDNTKIKNKKKEKA